MWLLYVPLCFNIRRLRFMHTVYLFQMILNMNTYFPVRVYCLFFVVERRCVYCEVGN